MGRLAGEQDQESVGLSEGWARETLERLAFAALAEQQRARRWRLFFRFAFLVVILAIFLGYEAAHFKAADLARHYTALVRLDGTISAGGIASASRVNHALRAAFAADPAGVILEADSPGGSPVQANEMNSEIWRLRHRYPHTPIDAVVQGLCASGCYYVVVATHNIYANPASLVGSIGVLMDGFGYTGLMKKLGISRRLLIAGRNKDFLDPFSPLTAAHRAFAEKMLRQIHQQFIDAVKIGRGDRLRSHPGLFSGLIWTGQRAKQLGLIDGFGTARYVARHIFKAPRIIDFSPKQSLITQVAQHMGTTMTQTFEEKLLSPLPMLR